VTAPSTVDPGVIAYLSGQFERGRPVLFSGAGFSLGAKDLDGKPLPSGGTIAAEISELIYPGAAPEEGTTLQDLFQAAHDRKRSELKALLSRRLSVSPASVPDYYRVWLSMPWSHGYTLNVDDLPAACNQHFALPRAIATRSALREEHFGTSVPSASDLVMTYLNGVVADAPDLVTFSTAQYGKRLAAHDPWYQRLVADLLSQPFVFIGTKLDESPLWQHIELRGSKGVRGQRELRPRSFLVTPTLPRAKRDVLQGYNVEWLAMNTEEFAATVLDPILRSPAAKSGLKAIAKRQQTSEGATIRIEDVASLIAGDKASTASLFLVGAEPTWSDLSSGRAIHRDVDNEAYRLATIILAAGREKTAPSGEVLLITGTAAAGKSSCLMRLCARLSAEGAHVAWIDREAIVGIRQIKKHLEQHTTIDVLAIDDADRYGAELVTLVNELTDERHPPLVACAMRASKVERSLNPARLKVKPVEISMPGLTDPDIGGLIEVLGRENRLGKLRGKSRREQEEAFRERAGRQLLVAMLEATSNRRFEEKVYDEWQELQPDSREAYALIAVATSLRSWVTKDELLIASGDASNERLNSVDDLLRRHVVLPAANGAGLRARHRRIAEVLVDEFKKHGSMLAQAHQALAFALAVKCSSADRGRDRGAQLLKTITNHDYLFRMLNYSDAARVYEAIADLMKWDYHYWLQRGSLEVEEGDIRLAENFLEQARSLNSSDPYVLAEFAYMLFKKACSSPGNPSAMAHFKEGLDILKDQIDVRGAKDGYPYHILGSQVIAWCNRAPLHYTEKKALLQMALGEVGVGVRRHPHIADLRQLEADLKRALLSLEVA
jgi:tetratricopeptide (TPR) repeat protein